MNSFVFVSSLFESWAKLQLLSCCTIHSPRTTERDMAGRDEGFRRVLVTGANGKVGVRVVQAFQGVQGSADGGLPWQVVATGKSIVLYPYYIIIIFGKHPNLYAHGTRARF